MAFKNVLIGGATDTGKTMTIKNILLDEIEKYNDKDLDIIIFDKKENEYSSFEQTKYMKEKAFNDEKMFIDYLKKFDIKNDKRKIIVIEEFKNILDYLEDKKEDYDFFISIFIKSVVFNCSFILSTSIIKPEVILGVLKGNSPTRINTGTIKEIESQIILDDDCRGEIKNKEDIVIQNNNFGLRKEKINLIE